MSQGTAWVSMGHCPNSICAKDDKGRGVHDNDNGVDVCLYDGHDDDHHHG